MYIWRIGSGCGSQRTDLIQLDSVVLCAHLTQELLGRAAVWAVGLAEDGCECASAFATRTTLPATDSEVRTNGIVVDDALGLGLCSRHTRRTGGACEELA